MSRVGRADYSGCVIHGAAFKFWYWAARGTSHAGDWFETVPHGCVWSGAFFKIFLFFIEKKSVCGGIRLGVFVDYTDEEMAVTALVRFLCVDDHGDPFSFVVVDRFNRGGTEPGPRATGRGGGSQSERPARLPDPSAAIGKRCVQHRLVSGRFPSPSARPTTPTPCQRIPALRQGWWPSISVGFYAYIFY